MNKDILMPDYNHSILNLITSILKNYGIETKYNSLEKIDKLLKRKYKNVVLVILDGMGENILENISPDGLFYKNKMKSCNFFLTPRNAGKYLPIILSGSLHNWKDVSW